jgi:hypothetical protein
MPRLRALGSTARRPNSPVRSANAPTSRITDAVPRIFPVASSSATSINVSSEMINLLSALGS